MVGEQKETTSGEHRLGATFHRSFSMSRPAIGQVLQITHKIKGASDKRQCLDRETIRELTHLGTIYVEAMPRYGYGTGLLDNGNCLTRLGNAVLQYDRLLEKPDTLWLMHYFLSSPQGPGPINWHELVITRFRTGDEFSSDDIAVQISKSFERTEGKQLADRSARSTATVFLGTYTKDDALGSLGLLEAIPVTNRYRVLDPEPPSAWAFGYALLHYWRSQFGDLVTINLDSLYSDNGIGSIFLCGSGRVNRMLTALQAEGFIDVYRVAPPFQVVLLRPDPEALLRKIYASHDPD
jgi:hypothetical protein